MTSCSSTLPLRLALACGLLGACSGVEELGGPRLDASLVPDLSRVHVSARDASDRIAVVGLDGALRGFSWIELRDGKDGGLLGEGSASGAGAFAILFAARDGGVVIRLWSYSRDAYGPDVALTVPISGTALRSPLVDRLGVRVPGPDHVIVTGALGAAPPGSAVVVGSLSTPGGWRENRVDGSFSADLLGNASDDLVVFAQFVDDPSRASPPVALDAKANPIPTLVSAVSGTEGLVVLTPEGSVGPGFATVLTASGQTELATLRIPDTGSVALCAAGVAASERLRLRSPVPPSKGDVDATPTVPGSAGVPSLMATDSATGITTTVSAGRVTAAGPLPSGVRWVLLANCATGSWTTESATNGTVDVSLAATSGDLVALVAVAPNGGIGRAEFVLAGAARAVPVPPVAMDAAALRVSGPGGPPILAAVTPGATTPGARIEGRRGPVVSVGTTTSAPTGTFALKLEESATTEPLVVTQSLGTFRSPPVTLAQSTTVVPGAIDGLVSFVAGSSDIAVTAHSAAFRSAVIAANLATGDATTADPKGEALSLTLQGHAGDEIATFGWSAGAGGRAVVRRALVLDRPFVTSAPGGTLCAMGPAGGDDVAIAELRGPAGELLSPLTVAHVSAGQWVATGTGSGTTVAAGPAGGPFALRPVPALAPASTVDALQITSGASGVTFSAAAGGLGPDWLLAIAAPSTLALLEPPEAPWSKTFAGLVGKDGGVLRLVAVERATGKASACRAVSIAAEKPLGPALASVVPAPLRVGEPFSVAGQGFSVPLSLSVGGITQPLSVTTSDTLQGVLQGATPRGAQKLVVTTPEGTDAVDVTVIALPKLDAADPSPLHAYESATLIGVHLGATASVTIGGVASTIVAATEATVTIDVAGLTPVGAQTLVLTTDVGETTLAVEVVCPKPALNAAIPTKLNLGEPVTLAGSNLADVEILLLGKPQIVSASSDAAVSFTVHPGTPTGTGELWLTSQCGTLVLPATVAVAPPTITSVSPAPLVLGKTATVVGTHLSSAAVSIGGTSQPTVVTTATELTFTVESGTPVGLQSLSVSTAGGSDAASVQVRAPPILTSVTPNPVNAGQALVLKGSDLDGATVTVGGVSAQVTASAPTQLTIQTGLDTPAGPQPVVASTAAGSATVTVLVSATPVILSVAPVFPARGKALSIQGKNLSGGTVTIGGVGAVVLAPGAQQLVVSVSLATPLGEQSLTVQTASGKATLAVTVVDAPDIISVAPTPLVVGKGFTVTGTHFGAGIEARIGGVLQTLSVTDATIASGVVALDTPTGPQSLLVTSPTGGDTEAVAVIGPPALTSVAPDPVAVGTSLTLIGSGLFGSKITVGGVEAVVVSESPTALVVIVGAATPPGLVVVVVMNPAGVATQEVNVITLPPVITSVEPAPLYLDEPALVHGEYLLGAKVTVAGKPATVTKGSHTLVELALDPTTPFGTDVLVVTTQGGQTSAPVMVSPPLPMAEPVLATISPNPVALGEKLTLTGQHLKGGQVVLGPIAQPTAVATSGKIVLTVDPKTPLGVVAVKVTTAKGSISGAVTVTTKGPVIDSVSPNPVHVGGELIVTGSHLADFSSCVIGGTIQIYFSLVSDTELRLTIDPATSHGNGQVLAITGPGGTATALLDLLPQGVVAPVIAAVVPGEIRHGEVLTVSGKALNGATFTLGGVTLTPELGAKDNQVQLIVTAEVPPGVQTLVVGKDGAPSAQATVSVLPDAPAQSLIYTSGISGQGTFVLVALPGAVLPGATLLVQAGGDFQAPTTAADGSVGLVMEGVKNGTVVLVSQLAESLVSDPIQRVAELPAPDAPRAPHHFLTRVERTTTGVRLAGPPPTFGADGTIILVTHAGRVGYSLAEKLHLTPLAAIEVSLGAPPTGLDKTYVFAAGGPAASASAPLVAFPVDFDPPMLASGVTSLACLVSLPGTVPPGTPASEATAVLALASGSNLDVLSVATVTGPAGELLSTAAVNVAGPAEYRWTGLVGALSWQLLVPAGTYPLLLAGDFSTTVDGGWVTVTASNGAVGPNRLLVVATASGRAAASFSTAGGNATVVVPSAGSPLYVFAVSMGAAIPSACLSLNVE